MSYHGMGTDFAPVPLMPGAPAPTTTAAPLTAASTVRMSAMMAPTSSSQAAELVRAKAIQTLFLPRYIAALTRARTGAGLTALERAEMSRRLQRAQDAATKLNALVAQLALGYSVAQKATAVQFADATRGFPTVADMALVTKAADTALSRAATDLSREWGTLIAPVRAALTPTSSGRLATTVTLTKDVVTTSGSTSDAAARARAQEEAAKQEAARQEAARQAESIAAARAAEELARAGAMLPTPEPDYYDPSTYPGATPPPLPMTVPSVAPPAGLPWMWIGLGVGAAAVVGGIFYFRRKK